VTYPLEAARTLRSEELEAAKRALGVAIEHVNEAEAVLQRAEARREAHASSTRQAELKVTGPGVRSADALLQGQAYLKRLRSEAEALTAKVSAAQDALRTAREGVERARDGLAEARAQAEAVERHHAKWVAERARKAERKAEDEADDRSSSHRGE